MELLKMCLVLLLPLSVCFYSEVTLVKTVGKETDVTPLCTNETLDQIVCKMRTERMGGEECRLLYRHGHNFINECGSKFKLVTINQTVFLHLSSLTPADGGNYTCECVNLNGTFFYHLNITVEENEEGSSFTEDAFPHVFVGVTVLIVVILVILGFIYRKLRLRKRAESVSIPPDWELLDIEPYSIFRHTGSGLYSVVKVKTNESTILTTEDINLP
ncbi:uncharacterized protein LOC121635465 [Melanotaenia boesemani]|uniref:uncharacterized protein LOC121635465 n=1 Tax=Melanotaenia boesemani TaxID=1250792 RepID=UPI001C054C0F|nr:uncharacterized protein LOC121635465 [Melanotaenia boesemani]